MLGARARASAPGERSGVTGPPRANQSGSTRGKAPRLRLEYFATFEICLDVLLQPPHRPHLFARGERQLILDVLRALLRPVAVVEQHFTPLRRRELDHAV